MLYLVLFATALAVGIVLRLLPRSARTAWLSAGSWIAFAAAVVLAASSSFVIIDQDAVGHLKRVLWGANMKPGQIIAFDGEKGPQAEVLGPGFHVIPSAAAWRMLTPPVNCRWSRCPREGTGC